MPTKRTRADRLARAIKERERYKRDYWKIREKRKERAEEFKSKKLDYKRGLECANPFCSVRFSQDVSKCEFHHIDPKKKKFSPHKATSWKAFISEVEKCVPLCKDCHAKAEGQKKRYYARKRRTEQIPF